MAKNNDDHYKRILYFLNFGWSMRGIDTILGKPNSNGSISQRILKKRYKLADADKSKLFGYTLGQSEEVIQKIMTKPKVGYVDTLIQENPSERLEKYFGTYLVVRSFDGAPEDVFEGTLSGETRNITQIVFKPQKDLIKKCQFRGCSNKKELDTAHCLKERPEIFKESAKKSRKKLHNGAFEYDIYKTMRLYLKAHTEPRCVCFLCKDHHNQLHEQNKKSQDLYKRFLKDNIEFL